MKTTIVILLILFCQIATAQNTSHSNDTLLPPKTSEKVYVARIDLMDGRKVRGVIEKANDSSIEINKLEIKAEEIRAIHLLQKNSLIKGVGYCLFVGASTGALFSLIENENSRLTEKEQQVIGGVLFSLSSVILGVIIESLPHVIVVATNGSIQAYKSIQQNLQTYSYRVVLSNNNSK